MRQIRLSQLRQKVARVLLAGIFVVAFTGCGALGERPVKQASIYNNSKEDFAKNTDSLVDDLKDYGINILEADDFSETIPEKPPQKKMGLLDEIRLEMKFPDYSANPRVAKDIKWFQKHPAYINRALQRSKSYIHYIYQQTKARNMPSELVFLPLLESAFNPVAYSSTGASGLWQLMPETAISLGVKINWWYDGRRDITDSTRAALDYLTLLYEIFDHDWLLTIASYNTGDINVKRAIARNEKKNLPTDFWHLDLNQETKDYVPRMLAIVAVIKNPEKFGIKLEEIDNLQRIQPIKLDHQINLTKAASLAKIDLKTLRLLNPGYLRWVTDPDSTSFLLLPVEKVETFKRNFATYKMATNKSNVIWDLHVVQNNENLSLLAKKYATNASAIKKVNKLKDNNIWPHQQLVIPKNFKGKTTDPLLNHAMQLNARDLPKPNLPKLKKGRHLITYKVLPGDSLYLIAKKFNSTVKNITQTNKLKGAYLRPGQVIKINSNIVAKSAKPKVTKLARKKTMTKKLVKKPTKKIIKKPMKKAVLPKKKTVKRVLSKKTISRKKPVAKRLPKHQSSSHKYNNAGNHASLHSLKSKALD